MLTKITLCSFVFFAFSCSHVENARVDVRKVLCNAPESLKNVYLAEREAMGVTYDLEVYCGE